jgi:hypothetical protein
VKRFNYTVERFAWKALTADKYREIMTPKKGKK